MQDHWQHLAAGYALAALQEREFRLKDKREQVLAILWLQSLHEIQFAKHGEPEASNIKICDEGAAKRELRPYDFNPHYTRLFLSVGALLIRVLKIAKEQAGVPDAQEFDEEFHAWLPKGLMRGVDFRGRYPDRSNIEKRQELHQLYDNDPDSLTPDGAEEARQFVANDLSEAPPF